MSEPDKTPPADPEWWTPWAVLVGIVLVGLLGYFGVFSPKRGGPTAADVPTVIANPAPSSEPGK